MRQADGTARTVVLVENTLEQREARQTDSIEWDHLVALKQAYDSGRQGWTKDEWKAFSNDLDNLIQVCKSCNASRQEKALFSEWQPPSMSPAVEQAVRKRMQDIISKYGLKVGVE